MTPVELIAQNIRLEYQVTAGDHRLIPFPNSSEQARCVIHKHVDGYELFLRHDLPTDAAQQILALPREVVFNDPERLKTILRPWVAMWFGKSYYFPDAPDPARFPDVVYENQQWVIKVNGEVVSQAWSVRENERAAELAVETAPAFRRRGYARQVTLAWAHHVLSQSRVAFYSHNHDNLASQALAQQLGLVQYTEGKAYE